MRILLVCDQFFGENNGTTISARRFKNQLEKNGNEVRVVCAGTIKQGEYCTTPIHIPFFDGLVTSQGMTFAKADKTILRKATQWAEIVHIYMPFSLARAAIKICKENGTPFTGAFHVQPENITSSVHLVKFQFINKLLYKNFRNKVYKYCNHVHCPSQMIANELKKYKYTSQLHIISNGIDPIFKYTKKEKDNKFKNKFLILNVGRYSVEKKQASLIEAIAISKYSNKIQLILAGQGPLKKKLEKAGNKLDNKVIMKFYSKEDLVDVISKCDLYVHPAKVEIEAIACMEAFACGLVPIIAKSEISATSQFALNDNCLFDCENIYELRDKIDWWLDQKTEREKWGKLYSESALKYSQANSVLQIQEMFKQAIKDNGK